MSSAGFILGHIVYTDIDAPINEALILLLEEVICASVL